jgi:hypothetical protein
VRREHGGRGRLPAEEAKRDEVREDASAGRLC